MQTGLEGMVAADTGLSEVDGERGQLLVRGFPIEHLVGRIGFDSMIDLLWRQDEAPQAVLQSPRLGQGLGRARSRAWALFEPAVLRGMSAMAGLRVGLSHLTDEDPLLTVAAVAVLVAAQTRLERAELPLAPDPTAPHAADFLRMVTGAVPTDEAWKALDGYWVTVAEHGMNASTFTARVVTSTQAGLQASIIAALCALQGPLHGGAPGPVLDMLDAIGTADRAQGWLEGELQQGRRLMGFGHRIYRVRDPRADALQGLLGTLPSTSLGLAREVEKIALAVLHRHKPDRTLQTNVEFYTAVLLQALSIPRPFFTPVFACARVAGWVAHVMEQTASGRLIRPRARYTGPRDVTISVA